MRSQELEHWVLQIAEMVENNQQVEDSRIELKADWPTDMPKAARRIAGHANAAQGDSILWIIGIDEKGQKITGASANELSNWHAQLIKEFQDVAPEVQELSVMVGDKSVVGILFTTDRAPYVVRNPKQSAITLEVPWRVGTRVETASRQNLLSVLVPQSTVPDFEFRNGYARVNYYDYGEDKENEVQLIVDLSFYVYPKSNSSLVVPNHKCQIEFNVSNWITQKIVELDYIGPPQMLHYGDSYRARNQSRTIDASRDEMIVYGPGLFKTKSTKRFVSLLPERMDSFRGHVEMLVLPAQKEVTIEFELPTKPIDEQHEFFWEA